MAIQVTHYSDVLCVWAYVAQIRVTELERNFADDVAFDFRYFSVFGDVPGKLARQWSERGGHLDYADHVAEVAARFPHATLHPDTWRACVPRSSMPAHLLLCAARAFERDGGAAACGELRRLDSAIRTAFFADGRDISRREVLLDVAAGHGCDAAALAARLDDGTAHALLADDALAAADQHVRASPTLVFNEGRQMLTGNVGYRVLEANVRELLHHPSGQQSWC
ncbi:MAG: DsbA family protein [Gammaproteobacteria bacterium]|nr:DsbA family protein [Gammaproteobacteria bacterium]